VPVREVFRRRAQPSRHLFNHILSPLPLRAIVIAFYRLVRFLEASFPTHVESGPRCLLARSWQSYQSWQRPRLDQERKTVSCERGTTSSPAPLPRFCSSPAAIPSISARRLLTGTATGRIPVCIAPVPHRRCPVTVIIAGHPQDAPFVGIPPIACRSGPQHSFNNITHHRTIALAPR
jgi:hypothetical protein